MCLGPAPARVATKGGSFGMSFPFAASRRKTKTRSSPLSGTAMNRPLGSNTASWGCELARARLAGQVDQIAARPQVSVLLDRHHADRAGAVISGDDPAAGRINRQVHRVLATTGLPVERRDTPVLLVDRICTDLLEVGMHRIEKALRPVERQEGGVDDLEELLVAPGARGRVHSVDVDTAAMPFALRGGEGADIREERRCAVGSRLRFGISSPQQRWACGGKSRPTFQHNTPVDALVSSR